MLPLCLNFTQQCKVLKHHFECGAAPEKRPRRSLLSIVQVGRGKKRGVTSATTITAVCLRSCSSRFSSFYIGKETLLQEGRGNLARVSFQKGEREIKIIPAGGENIGSVLSAVLSHSASGPPDAASSLAARPASVWPRSLLTLAGVEAVFTQLTARTRCSRVCAAH